MTAFQEALQKGRSRYNAAYAAAKRAGGDIEPDLFAGWLRDTIAPIIHATAAARPERTEAVLDALYEISLNLLGRDLAGPRARTQAINAGWKTILPRIPFLLAEHPAEIAGQVSNALHTLESLGADTSLWISLMGEMENRDRNRFLDCGRIAAWRVGAANQRSAALEAVDRVDRALALHALGLTDWEQIGELRRNPWYRSEKSRARGLAIVSRLGSFRGFAGLPGSGLFIAPPQVFASDGRLFAFDGENTWIIHADRFGSLLVRTPYVEGSFTPDPRVRLGSDGDLRLGTSHGKFPDLARSTSHAYDGVTLAVTVSWSHAIRLLAVS